MATASSQRVRYVAAGEVNKTRLQVFSRAGAQVFDSAFRLGNLIDWQLEDQQGLHLTDGSYLFLITVQDFSDNLTQKYGTAQIDQDEVYLQQNNRDELPRAQAAALESNIRSAVCKSIDGLGASGLRSPITEPKATQSAAPSTNLTTSVANVSGSGTTGQLPKWTDGSAGTLGDSAVAESMDGNVGIGTTSPISPSHFARMLEIRGSTASLLLSSTAAGSNFEIGADGEGRLRFIPLIGSSHTLAIQQNGNIGIGTINPSQKLEVAGTVKLSGSGNGLIYPDGTSQLTAQLIGPAGPAGSVGPQGAKGETGAPGLIFRGTYQSSTVYKMSDAVYFNGSSYISIADNNQGNEPDTSTGQWSLLAKQGSDCPAHLSEAPGAPVVIIKPGVDIQAAVDGGGIIIFPEGTYELTKTIVVRKTNTIIQGSGPGTVFIFKPDLPQVHCVNDRAFTTPCDVEDTVRRQITQPINLGDNSFTAAGDLSDLHAGDWLIVGENDQQVGTPVIIDWAQVESVSGNIVHVLAPFRTAFPNARAWDPKHSGLGFYRIPQLVEGVQFRNFTVIVPDSGEGAPGISVFAAKRTLIDSVTVQDSNGQPLYSYLAKDLTITNSRGEGGQVQSGSEFGATVDLKLERNTFSSEGAALALDLGTGFFEISQNQIPSSSNIGMYLLYGVHDGMVNDNLISFVRCGNDFHGGNAFGIAAVGSQRVRIKTNYLAGGAGSGSIGISVVPANNTAVPIMSFGNTITPNSFGNAWGVQYDPDNVP
jgi:hypothetical protein